jgi:chromosomal replication initiation ATPase DnaA
MAINVWPVGIECVEKRLTALCKEAGHGPFRVAQILGPRRDRDLIQARAALACKLRQDGYSLKRIGQAMNRDHTSVLHLIQKYGKLYDARDQNQSTDPSVR